MVLVLLTSLARRPRTAVEMALQAPEPEGPEDGDAVVPSPEEAEQVPVAAVRELRARRRRVDTRIRLFNLVLAFCNGTASIAVANAYVTDAACGSPSDMLYGVSPIAWLNFLGTVTLSFFVLLLVTLAVALCVPRRSVQIVAAEYWAQKLWSLLGLLGTSGIMWSSNSLACHISAPSVWQCLASDFFFCLLYLALYDKGYEAITEICGVSNEDLARARGT